MASHNFSFEGGELLGHMGASWFASYAYYEKVDRSHRNWERVPTSLQLRISNYNKGRIYHKGWLHEVLAMNPANLNKNKIGLNSEQIKAMAKEVLDHWSD